MSKTREPLDLSIDSLTAEDARELLDPFLLRSASEDGLDLTGHLHRAVAEIILGIETGQTTLWGAWNSVGRETSLVGIFQVDQSFDAHLGPYYLFRRLYVREEYRRRGVAHKLLRAAGQGLTRGRPILIMMRRPLPRLYRRLGFLPHTIVYHGDSTRVLAYAARRK